MSDIGCETSPPAAAVFDIDGVLADVRHRLHHLSGPRKDWAGFFDDMGADGPVEAGLAAVKQARDDGLDVIYITGRPEAYRAVTQGWLTAHGLASGLLLMRPDRDRRPARVWKPTMLRRLAQSQRICYVVDDDEDVVKALRAEGFDVTLADWMGPAPHLQAAQEVDGRT